MLLLTKIIMKIQKNTTNYLIDLFKTVNPCYQRLFANKTEREAIERLLERLGEEKLERIIQVLPFCAEQQFCPTITTPFQLEKKLGELIIFFKKYRAKQKLVTNTNTKYLTFPLLKRKPPIKGLKQLREKVKKF